jgi:type VI secretion system secreted protein VgrG
VTVLEDTHIAFLSGALPDDGTLRLFGVEGRETLSRLYEFELYLTRQGEAFSPAELDALLDAPCAVALGPNPGDVMHGLLQRIRLLDTSGTLPPRYVATMVPTAWLLTLARSNRVFQEMTVPDMVQLILTQYGLAPGEDFDILVSGTHPTREYAVQYEETDWDFIQRWLEDEGFFYWFDHGGPRNKLVIADANSYATPITSPSAVSYRSRNDLAAGGLATVWEWGLAQQRVAARVAVFDYNYRTPHLRLIAKAPADPAGFGSVMHYNEHFKNTAEGAEVARVRAERILCARKVFSGWTDCARFRVGHVFQLQDHYDGTNDGQYLITAMEHQVGHGIPDPGRDIGAEGQNAEATPINHYKARFEAIPLAIPYRPERLTPWPSIHGVVHGHVEEDSPGEYAQIDELGRYKIRLPFDSGNAVGTLASRWIRMAQPYSGAAYGSHHPLHKGTEVLITHIDGDPDRPIIVASIPHAHTVSPVQSPNATQSVVHTPSGIRIEMEDLQE